MVVIKEIGIETDNQCDQKKIAKCCPKMIWLEKWKILKPLQKLPKNVGDLGELVVAKGFKKLPKVQKTPNLVTVLISDHSDPYKFCFYCSATLHVTSQVLQPKSVNKRYRGHHTFISLYSQKLQ